MFTRTASTSLQSAAMLLTAFGIILSLVTMVCDYFGALWELVS